MTATFVVVAYCVINVIFQTITQPKVAGNAVGITVTVSFVSLLLWSWVPGAAGGAAGAADDSRGQGPPHRSGPQDAVGQRVHQQRPDRHRRRRTGGDAQRALARRDACGEHRADPLGIGGFPVG